MGQDLRAHSPLAAPVVPSELISESVLNSLLGRSNRLGAARFAGHFAIIGLSGMIYAWLVLWSPLASTWISWVVATPAILILGFAYASLFACMHECLHRTAFKTRFVNDGIAIFAGLLSGYNSTFFRYSHGWHHRFTQISGKDPELDEPKPKNVWGYILEATGLIWWYGRIRTEVCLALGGASNFYYIPERKWSKVCWSARIYLLFYVLLAAIDIILLATDTVDQPVIALFWLFPLILGQPPLRLILLADHTGCTQDSNVLSNTRTTYPLHFARFLMWEMSFHAEHHIYPAIPFHALSQIHKLLSPHLLHITKDGYIGAQREILSLLHNTKTS